MSLVDLQSWLLQEGIRDDLDVITRLTVRMEIDNLAADPTITSVSVIDWPRLLLAGSILARSEERTDQEAALRIATAAISLTDKQALKDAAAVLLGKLSNFRAIALASDRKLLSTDVDARLSDLSSLDDMDKYEQVSAYLLATFMRLGSISVAGLAKRHDGRLISKLDETLDALVSQIEIDVDLAARHPGVSAIGLQRLLEAFRAYAGDVENLLPAEVASNDSYDRFVTIMGRINEHLFPAFTPAGRIRLYALVVWKWLKGFSLAKIIRDSIQWHQEAGRSFRLPELIRGTMELIEQIARFKAPKYLSAYMDVLNLYLREIGRNDLVDEGLDIGTQLEFGISSKTLLSLMELGLSRMSAVALYEKIARDDLSKEGCTTWIMERVGQFQAMDIPAIIIREMRERLMLPGDLAT